MFWYYKMQKISQGLLNTRFSSYFSVLALLVRNLPLPSIYSCSVVIIASWSRSLQVPSKSKDNIFKNSHMVRNFKTYTQKVQNEE